MSNVRIILNNIHSIRLVLTFFHLPCNAKMFNFPLINYVKEKHALLTNGF